MLPPRPRKRKRPENAQSESNSTQRRAPGARKLHLPRERVIVLLPDGRRLTEQALRNMRSAPSEPLDSRSSRGISLPNRSTSGAVEQDRNRYKPSSNDFAGTDCVPSGADLSTGCVDKEAQNSGRQRTHAKAAKEGDLRMNHVLPALVEAPLRLARETESSQEHPSSPPQPAQQRETKRSHKSQVKVRQARRSAPSTMARSPHRSGHAQLPNTPSRSA